MKIRLWKLLVIDKVTTVSGKDSVNVKLAIEKLEQKNISVDINY